MRGAAPLTLPSMISASSAGRPSLKGAVLATGMLGWTAFTWPGVGCTIDRPVLGEFPARTLGCFVIPVLLGLIFRGWLTRQALSQRLLVSLQFFRVIGLVLVFEQWRDTLPATFAEPAGWGDFIPNRRTLDPAGGCSTPPDLDGGYGCQTTLR
jgi:hypothetical protein